MPFSAPLSSPDITVIGYLVIPKFLRGPFPLVAVEGIPDLILNHGVLNPVHGNIGLECLEFIGRQIGEKLVFGLAVGG